MMSEVIGGRRVSRREVIERGGKGFGGLVLFLFGLDACTTADPNAQQRKTDFDATATAAAGQGTTEKSVGKFSPEVIRQISQSVGIIGADYARKLDGKKGGVNATAWIVQAPDGQIGHQVVTAGHVFANQELGYLPEEVTYVSFTQPIISDGNVYEYPSPSPDMIAVPQAYVKSVESGNEDTNHDVAAFDAIAFNTPPVVLKYDPDFQFEVGQQLALFGYPWEFQKDYPGTTDIDPAKTVMGVSLATVTDTRDIIQIQCEVDRGWSGGPAVAERNGEFYAVGLVSSTNVDGITTTYLAPLRDLPALLA